MIQIREEQLRVFERDVDERYRDRLCDVIADQQANTLVKLPEKNCTVCELDRRTLRSLTDASLALAESYGFDREPDQAAFTAIRFASAPNFDLHPAIAAILEWPGRTSSMRMKAIWRYTTNAEWEEIELSYDPATWIRKSVRGSHAR